MCEIRRDIRDQPMGFAYGNVNDPAADAVADRDIDMEPLRTRTATEQLHNRKGEIIAEVGDHIKLWMLSCTVENDWDFQPIFKFTRKASEAGK